MKKKKMKMTDLNRNHLISVIIFLSYVVPYFLDNYIDESTCNNIYLMGTTFGIGLLFCNSISVSKLIGIFFLTLSSLFFLNKSSQLIFEYDKIQTKPLIYIAICLTILFALLISNRQR